MLYEVAPPEAHVEATAQLQPLKARVPRGCLLRRVSLSLPVSFSYPACWCDASYRATEEEWRRWCVCAQ